MTISLPQNVSFIIERLNKSGFAAYAVGGCVRDSVLGIVPHDWDICTSARPEETTDVFRRLGYEVIETGVKYGTVTVVMKNSWQQNETFEITTFRIDGEYKDNRRPEAVMFTDDLIADLSRRDFTMNAMAYHPVYGLIDPFDGLDDIKQKYIRCVGDPQKRFEEDALRMLRAIRFALRYDYRIEYNTMLAIHQMEENIQSISVERVMSEITRILSETFFPDKSYCDPIIDQFKHFLSYFCPIEKINITSALSFCDNDLETSLAVLFDNENIKNNLLKLRFSTTVAEGASEIRKIGTYIINNNGSLHTNGVEFRFFARRIISSVRSQCDIYVAKCAVRYAMAKCNEELLPYLYRIERQIMRCADDEIPFHVTDLAITGNDVMFFGCEGMEIGFVLRHLLDKVMHEDLKNDRDCLIGYLESINDFPAWSRSLCRKN